MRKIISITVGIPGCCDIFTVGKGGLESVVLGEDFAQLHWKNGTMHVYYHIVSVFYEKDSGIF